MAVDKKTELFEARVVEGAQKVLDKAAIITPYSEQDSAPNFHGFTAFFDGEVYEVVITRVKGRKRD